MITVFSQNFSTAELVDRDKCWLGLVGAMFLVCVPVFAEAPLVRSCPSLALILTVGWLGLSRVLQNSDRSSHRWWGSLCWGFSLCWGCGAIYWGWLRVAPIWHIPIESMALPWAIWALCRNEQQGQYCDKYQVGAYFYLGSLTGTIVTDAYFHLNSLMETWAIVMGNNLTFEQLNLLLANAITQIHTPWGIGTAIVLTLVLLTISGVHLMQSKSANWVLSGAVLGTILVDFLFYYSSSVL